MKVTHRCIRLSLFLLLAVFFLANGGGSYWVQAKEKAGAYQKKVQTEKTQKESSDEGSQEGTFIEAAFAKALGAGGQIVLEQSFYLIFEISYTQALPQAIAAQVPVCTLSYFQNIFDGLILVKAP
jgi:hypothetical protein